MGVFSDYARYYDLIYKDKNYHEEAAYVDVLVREWSPDAIRLLDLGCGTGRHSLEFAKLGYQVTGIDGSADMVALANRNIADDASRQRPQMYCSDIRTFELGAKFDVIVSLFHVISYLETDDDLDQTFTAVRSHMHEFSVLIFDLWYGPAVLHLKPEKRQNRYVSNGMTIIRTSSPEIDISRDIVDVHYQLEVSGDGNNEIISETHRMRYFSIKRIRDLLSRNGLEAKVCYKWLSRDDPDQDNWSACILARPS